MPTTQIISSFENWKGFLATLTPYTTETTSTKNAVYQSQLDDDIQVFNILALKPEPMHSALVWMTSDMLEDKYEDAIKSFVGEMIESATNIFEAELENLESQKIPLDAPDLQIDLNPANANELVASAVRSIAVEKLIQDPRLTPEQVLIHIESTPKSFFIELLQKWYLTKKGLAEWSSDYQIMFTADATPVIDG